jgi:septal ring factor EnvC (AmiA/AmiB activator)
MNDQAEAKLLRELTETRGKLAVDRQRANEAVRLSADLHDQLVDAQTELGRLKDLYGEADTDRTVLAAEVDVLRAENARLKAECQKRKDALERRQALVHGSRSPKNLRETRDRS